MYSVTTILSIFNNFDGIPPAVLENAARRGTAVHRYFAGYALGLFMPVPTNEIAGYFYSFKAWFDTYVDRVFFVEQKFTDHKLGFYGHADAGLKLTDGRNVVVDWKTPAAESLTWGPQTAAYLHLANSEDKRVCHYDGCMAVQPKKDGRPATGIVYAYTDELFATFMAAKICYEYFHKKRG